MNNYDYSGLQKLLHHINLSSRFMRELSFDVEKSLYLKKCNVYKDNHVFLTGLARSGTTITLRAIHASGEFASLSYADMPFVLAPNLWDKLNPTTIQTEERERAHEDGIMVSTDSPEAFEEVFWQTFLDEEAKEDFEKYIQLILNKYKKKRYLSKNNQNVRRLKKINLLCPNSRILISFREPLQQANSLLNQHLKFIEKQKKDAFVKNYMDWIGHTEFGLNYHPIKEEGLLFSDSNLINHWLEQWLLTYSNLFSDFKNKNNILFICYESLCSNDRIWENLSDFIRVKKYNFDFVKSHKEVNQKFDPNLYGDCCDLYQDLVSITI